MHKTADKKCIIDITVLKYYYNGTCEIISGVNVVVIALATTCTQVLTGHYYWLRLVIIFGFPPV